MPTAKTKTKDKTKVKTWNRNSSENLIQLRSYLLWFLNEPTIKELMSEQRQDDLFDTLAEFIQQYNELLAENQRLTSFDRQLTRLGAGLACAKLIR